MKKITIDEPVELTEREEKIYNKGITHGILTAAGVVAIITILLLVIASI